MKVKQVNRYFCDFCDKKSLRKWSMEKHELHCTMNPDRVCRVCAMLAGNFPNRPKTAKPMAELKALLDPPHYYTLMHEDDFAERIKPLRAATKNCPACILSALRQQGVTSECFYDYAGEFKTWTDKINAEADQSEYLYS